VIRGKVGRYRVLMVDTYVPYISYLEFCPTLGSNMGCQRTVVCSTNLWTEDFYIDSLFQNSQFYHRLTT
jgi:hypothetical protein